MPQLTDTDPVAEWFKWWHVKLGADEDPRFLETWERALKIGQRVGVQRTARWAGLMPILNDMHHFWMETAVDNDVDLEAAYLQDPT